jgi:hypothetical protein
MNYLVVFSPEAEEQLVALYGYIAAAASPDIAALFTRCFQRNENLPSTCLHAHKNDAHIFFELR